MPSKTKPMVLVKWKDIIGKDEWQKCGEAELVCPQVFFTVGWLLCHKKDYLVVASCYSPEDDTVGTVTSIPTGTIIEVKEFRHNHRTLKPKPNASN